MVDLNLHSTEFWSLFGKKNNQIVFQNSVSWNIRLFDLIRRESWSFYLVQANNIGMLY